jgi:hypothetical protein
MMLFKLRIIGGLLFTALVIGDTDSVLVLLVLLLTALVPPPLNSRNDNCLLDL